MKLSEARVPENVSEEHKALLQAAAATYTVKPLKWERSADGATYTAYTPFGSYTIRDQNAWDDDARVRDWRWGYCFDEYYDEDQFDCATIAEGKMKAAMHWLDRLSGVLTPAGLKALEEG